MATYDQPVNNQAVVQSIQNLDAPAAVIAQIVNQIGTSNTGYSKVSVFTAPPTAEQVGGNAVVQIQTQTSGGAVTLDLSGLTSSQQNQLVAMIFTGDGDIVLSSTNTLGTQNVAAAVQHITNTHAQAMGIANTGGLHGTVVLSAGNNMVNVSTGGDLTISIPDAAKAGHLSAPGQSSGTWNSVIVLSGTGKESVFAGSGQDYIAMTGSGNNFVTLQGGNNSLDSVIGGVGNDTITVAGSFQGTAIISEDGGNNTLVVNSPIFTTAKIDYGYNEFTLSNGSKIDFVGIKNFILAQDGIGGNAQTLLDLSPIQTDMNVTVGNGNFNIFIGDGNDSVSLGVGNDSLLAGNGNDSVSLGGGKDSITMGSGNDLVGLKSGFQGSAVVDGGGGVNTLDLSQVTIQSAVKQPDGTVLVTLNNGSTVNAANIQNFIYAPATTAQAAPATAQHTAAAVNNAGIGGEQAQPSITVVGVQDLLALFNHY